MKIVPVLHKAKLKEIDEDLQNLQYWLSRPPIERIAAVTKLRAFSLEPGQRLDKTVFIKRKMHP
jgi:hypothetical protein